MQKFKTILLTIATIIFPLSLFIVGREIYKGSNATVHSETVDSAGDTPKINKDSFFDSETLFVDISGAVKFPGAYNFTSSPRVGEVIEKAGGFAQTADKLWVAKNINLVKRISDEQKIYIPYEWEMFSKVDPTLAKLEISKINSNVSGSCVVCPVERAPDDGDKVVKVAENPSVDSEKVNVNTASESELDELPGIGPAFAQKIISARPFATTEDLKIKAGLSESLIEKIKTEIVF